MIGALHGVSGCCQCCPLRRRLFCGGCSWVEYQRIIFLAWLSWLCPGASTAVCALSLWGVWVVGNVSGVPLVGVVFGALLGPEATGPFCSNAEGALLVFLFVPAAGSFLLLVGGSG